MTVASARLAPTDRSMPRGQDDQVLAHRDDGDDRGLGEDVADVAGLQEIRGEQADDDGKQDEDQQRPDAEEPQARAKRRQYLQPAVRPATEPASIVRLYLARTPLSRCSL